jgi:mRNA-degrading endonuclease RelE of RelBE toxin-antitoxin system
MPQSFRTRPTPHFERELRKLTRKNPRLTAVYEKAITILEEDPHNNSRRYDIEKLEDVKPGEGEWRIREGDYRIRYDIFGRDVVLYSFRHRREAYRKEK